MERLHEGIRYYNLSTQCDNIKFASKVVKMGMQEMEDKLDAVVEQQERLCTDVNDIRNTLQNFPRSWRMDDSNGHKKWNDLCDSVEELKKNQERWNKSAKWVIGMIGLGVATTVTTTVGLLVQGAYGQVDLFSERVETKIELERDRYNDRKEFIRHIEQGKYDGRLKQIEQIELENENRKTVLQAIAERKSELKEKEVRK